MSTIQRVLHGIALGFVDTDHPSHVCRLRKAINGLNHASRAWYTELKTYIKSLGFFNSHADKSLFVIKNGMEFFYLLVYVDDILVMGNNTATIRQILDLLVECLFVKDHKELIWMSLDR